ncbi:phosphoglycerate mutase-like protein [Cristinia sonorae]|uniref:Phosphoglycerate mutase-like protein n=1 Tax=Cristinia sonorae TaxID=1940300 RepID=A0A8K0UU53_9AGAR|nr:phosphoglycerate mutase-like protein [Cristinia sonorae]
MVETIYIARHGYRLNWDTTSWKSVTGLPRDPPLAAFGVTQAEELAAHFASLPKVERPTAIFSSPYYRCVQTSKPVSKALGVPIFVEHGLSEWYSPAAPRTGLHPRPGSPTSLRKYFTEIDDSWQPIYYPSRKGEDVEQCHHRAGQCVKAIVEDLERRFPGKHQRILLVSHAATIIAVVRELVGDRDLPLRPGCCSLTKLERKAGVVGVLGGWEPKLLVDGSHMAGGSTRDWGFEDIVIDRGHVVNDSGQPGSEEDVDEPVGLQVREPGINARM